MKRMVLLIKRVSHRLQVKTSYVNGNAVHMAGMEFQMRKFFGYLNLYTGIPERTNVNENQF